LPKIEQLVASRLRQALVERVVYPRFVAVGLPGLGIGEMATKHREKKARNQEGESDGEAEEPQGGLDEEADEIVDGLGGLGEKFIKGVLPTPGGVRESGASKEKRSTQRPEASTETGLGGGLQPMPGGSEVDWSRGRDR
jgi:hypothetical protein